jgi:hypothetical protein
VFICLFVPFKGLADLADKWLDKLRTQDEKRKRFEAKFLNNKFLWKKRIVLKLGVF